MCVPVSLPFTSFKRHKTYKAERDVYRYTFNLFRCTLQQLFLVMFVGVIFYVSKYRLNSYKSTYLPTINDIKCINIQKSFINVIMVIGDGLSWKEKHCFFNSVLSSTFNCKPSCPSSHTNTVWGAFGRKTCHFPVQAITHVSTLACGYADNDCS